MNLIDLASQRYATKVFDANKRLDAETFAQIKALLRLSPSSVNSQPWHFFIADNAAARQRLSQATQGAYVANAAKVLDASHVIVFCVKTKLDDAYLQKLLLSEEKDGRFKTPELKDLTEKTRAMYVAIHQEARQDTQDWLEKQVYLNMGTVLLGAAVLGVDAVPIEGFDAQILNEELGLSTKGLNSVAMIALGYRKADDVNAELPKSRLPEAEIMTTLA